MCSLTVCQAPIGQLSGLLGAGRRRFRFDDRRLSRAVVARPSIPTLSLVEERLPLLTDPHFDDTIRSAIQHEAMCALVPAQGLGLRVWGSHAFTLRALPPFTEPRRERRKSFWRSDFGLREVLRIAVGPLSKLRIEHGTKAL